MKCLADFLKETVENMLQLKNKLKLTGGYFMNISVIIFLLVMSIFLPMGIFYMGEKNAKRFKSSLVINIISAINGIAILRIKNSLYITMI